MKKPEFLDISEYDYSLPKERISQHPEHNREDSKLLVSSGAVISDHNFSEIVQLIRSDDALVLNESKVIKARLLFRKATGKVLEVFCLEPADKLDPAIALGQSGSSKWNCLVKGAKAWKSDPLEMIIELNGEEHLILAHKVSREEDRFVIRFEWKGDVSFSEILEYSGKVPLPPYMNREADQEDVIRYQTIYARQQGSVAAPTAGLHFTQPILDSLEKQGTQILKVILHVGAGTFKPVSAENAADHIMHKELIHADRHLFESLANVEGRIVTVGTTSMRTLESLYWIGLFCLRGDLELKNGISLNQWDVYREWGKLPSRSEVFKYLADQMKNLGMNSLKVWTGIIISPSYEFQVCDGLITNFHQPRSTLLILVKAFIGNHWKDLYDHALQSDYRFLSYGDASFLTP